MLRKLSKEKRHEYDEFCDRIRGLIEEINHLEDVCMDTTQLNKQLEEVLNSCLEFVRREFK